MIEKLLEIPLSQRLAIVGFIVVFIGLVYYMFFFSPTSDEMNATQGRNRALSQQLAELKRQKIPKDVKDIDKKKRDIEQRMKELDDILPPKPEIDSFIRSLQEKADTIRDNTYELEITKRIPRKSAAFSRYLRIPIQIEMKGTFNKIVVFFKALRNPKESDRIVNISDLRMKAERDSEPTRLHVKFTATTFSRMGK